MSDAEKIAVNAKISAIKESIMQNESISSELQATVKLVEDRALEVVEAMSIVFESKKQSLDSLREWRKTIERESTSIQSAVVMITKTITSEKINQLREVVELLERLNKIEPNMITSRLFNEGKE